MKRSPLQRASTLVRKTPLRAKTPMSRGTSTLSRSPIKKTAEPVARRQFKVRKKGPTAAESRHMSAVAALGCVVCRNLGYGATPCELHHPRESAGAGQKSSNMDVIPLCPQHHRLGGYGVAYHAGPEAWEANFGSELSLLAQTNRELSIKEK